MYDIDYFSYTKEPIVRIKQIGIYPLDDKGRAKYFSKDSYTHHYLRKTDPSVFNQIINNKDINEEEKQKTINQESLNNQNHLNTLTIEKNNEALKTEPNQNSNISPHSLKNNTISTNSTRNRVTLNQRYIDNMNEKKRFKKKLNNLRYKSYSKTNKNKNLYVETEDNKKEKDSNNFIKTFNDSGHKKMTQSFDKNARLTGLKVFKNKMAKTNVKLPLIMGGFNHGNSYVINNIRTDSKEMGEKYNPYNFISPHVNRTKRNYVGGLFHC